jgi:hypothetical protein
VCVWDVCHWTNVIQVTTAVRPARGSPSADRGQYTRRTQGSGSLQRIDTQARRVTVPTVRLFHAS